MSSIPPPPPPPPPPPGGFPPAPPPGYQAYGVGGAGAPSNYASFGARLGAVLLDGLIGVLFALPGWVAFLVGPRHYVACTVNNVDGLCHVPTAPTIGLAVLLWLIGTITYLVIYCKKVAAGQSWGQKAAGIRIADANTGNNITAGRAFGRQLARILSGCLCYLGYLWMLWDARKQTWHDKICNTVVVRA